MSEVTTNSSSTLGRRVRFARKAQGLAQGDLQGLGGPSRITLSRIEMGVGLPGRTYQATLEAISDALKCRVEWLKTGEGPVWMEGFEPTVDPNLGGSLAHSVSRRFNRSTTGSNRPPLSMGTHISNGPVDWLIVTNAITHLERYLTTTDPDPAARKSAGLNTAFALQILYAHLVQQSDPLGSIDERDLQTLVRVALVR